MLPLEDNAGDVIGKAQRGLEIADSELAALAGVTAEDVRSAREGAAEPALLAKIAPALQLDAPALQQLAAGKYQPNVDAFPGLAMFTTNYGDMAVNAFLAWDPHARQAVAFDTGANAKSMIATAESERLTIELILLTHTHPDHVADLETLTRASGARVYVPAREAINGAEPIDEGRGFSVGKLQIRSTLTWGHSRGGMTYFLTGLTSPIAIVGDAIFAGSMGGGAVSYRDAWRTNRDKILTLPDETIICPGHGPLTTVANEKRHNPFFAAEFRK